MVFQNGNWCCRNSWPNIGAFQCKVWHAPEKYWFEIWSTRYEVSHIIWPKDVVRLCLGLLPRNFKTFIFKGSPDPTHFIFEINVGKRRIRLETTLNIIDFVSSRFLLDLESKFQSRSMSDPSNSDIDFKNKMAWVWTTLKGLPMSVRFKIF